MTELTVTSRKNPLLQQVRRLLTSRRERQESGLFVADGTKLLEEAVRWCPGLQTVIVSQNVAVSVPDTVQVVRVPEDVMESVSPMKSPQGALFICKMPPQTAFVPQKGMLLLDGIQDAGNLGTILRTADALNVPVALLEGCADPYNHKTVRASMGAVFRTDIVQTTWQEAFRACQQGGVTLGVTALTPTAQDIRQAQPGDLAVVIGSEGQGVRQEILQSASQKLIIPMNPHCESLNAAVAAALVMWEMKRV